MAGALWLTALIACGGAAHAQERDPRLIHDGLDCFNWPKTPQRLCAQWRLIATAKGGFEWTMAISGVGMESELFKKNESFNAKDKAKLIALLRKGHKWSETAIREGVEVVKRIGVVGGRLMVDFLSTEGGRECVVRFEMKGWLEKGPVFMFVPYAPQDDEAQGIGALITALEGSQADYDRQQREVKRTQRLFN